MPNTNTHEGTGGATRTLPKHAKKEFPERTNVGDARPAVSDARGLPVIVPPVARASLDPEPCILKSRFLSVPAEVQKTTAVVMIAARTPTAPPREDEAIGGTFAHAEFLYLQHSNCANKFT